jgi:hypothetical protein
MSFWMLMLWALLMLVQSASFTLVSRARNSGSLWFNGVASTLSNGIWFIGQFVVIVSVLDVVKSGSWLSGAGYALWYILWNVAGGVTMQWLSMKYFEKGKRKVGG